MVEVRYTGPRYHPMRVHVYVNGQRYNGQGYLFGQRRGYSSALVSQDEADVLTGATQTLRVPGGETPINGFVIDGFSDEQLAQETWEAGG